MTNFWHIFESPFLYIKTIQAYQKSKKIYVYIYIYILEIRPALRAIISSVSRVGVLGVMGIHTESLSPPVACTKRDRILKNVWHTPTMVDTFHRKNGHHSFIVDCFTVIFQNRDDSRYNFGSKN